MTAAVARNEPPAGDGLVLAALSGSGTRVPVLGFTKLFASMYGAEPCALHVAEPEYSDTVGEFAFSEQVGLQVVDGNPVREIVRAGRHPAVRLVVIGTHIPPNGHGPGVTTLDIATRLDRPLLVVPAGATVPAKIDRVLFPLEGTTATTAAIKALIEHLRFEPNTEMFVLHTFTNENMPMFANHQPHETDAWVHAFLQRHVPGGVPVREIVMRCGPPERVIPEVAATLGATLTVVAWSQILAPGRALAVKALLSDPKRPTLLVPTNDRVTAPMTRGVVTTAR